MLSPTPLMRIVTGFWSFKTLATAVELDLFTTLQGGRTVTAAQARDEFGISERGADMLLAALAALDLLEHTRDGYRNSPLAEQFLIAGDRYDFSSQVSYCDEQTYLSWHRLTEALRADRPLTWDPDQQPSLFTTDNPTMLARFWDAMYASSVYTARALSHAYDFGSHKTLLDVGGGAGAYPVELCRTWPQLAATIYDLPHVGDLARQRIADTGLTDRISVTGGDFLADVALPRGHDVILLSMILHDWDEPTNRALLAKCHAALPSGGVVIIAELMLNAERTGPAEAALMGLNMIVETEGGRNYSEPEYAGWLADSGFTDVHTVRFDAPAANGAVLARKP